MPGPPDLVPSFVRFSNNGRFFVLYETTHAGGRTGRYSVWETSTPDGMRIWERTGARMLPYPFAFEVYPGMAQPFNAALRVRGDKLVLWENPSYAKQKVDAPRGR